jgi:hypothetical protein
LTNHPGGAVVNWASVDVERICQWSGGLPVHLNRLIERCEFFDPEDILNDANEGALASNNDEVPQTLKLAVEELQTSGSATLQRAFLLLKVLTILRDGETLDSIRRFDTRKPFHIDDVEELICRKLLTTVPVSRTMIRLTIGSGRKGSENSRPSRILVVPRQVRDYVNRITTDQEKAELVSSSAVLLFGPDWRQGKIKIRGSLNVIYGQSTLIGPGNEHIVARHLLQDAMSKKRRLVGRYAQLACGYCQRLLSADRYRDAYIASLAIYGLLKDSSDKEHFVQISHIYGKSLRMIGRREEAIPIVTAALEAGKNFLIPDNKAAMHLTLAYCYQREDKA